jgi:hypothetical protein
MGLGLAIRRSYRYFLPGALLTPRMTARRLYDPMCFYFIGLSTGIGWASDRGEENRKMLYFGAGALALLLLKWWAGAPSNNRSADT